MTSSTDQLAFCAPSDLQAASNDLLLLDVRTPAEFRERHIKGSVLLPLADLEASRVEALLEGKRGCTVICGSGKRAAAAAEKLHAAGLTDVTVLEGGIQAWEAAGLPLLQGKAAISLERQVRIAAGALVAAGSLLAYIVSPLWIALPGLVGCGLVFAGVTDTCGMGLLLARMPWNK